MKWFHLLKSVGKMSAMKLTAMSVAAAMAAGSIGAGGYIMYDYENIPQEIETARVIEVAQADPEEIPEPAEEEIVEEEPEEEPEEIEEEKTIELSVTATSIEKDLKIKIQDQQSKLVTGVQFAVTVTADKKGAKSSSYEDKDKDGIIYINKIDAGKYTVELQEIEGYVLKTASIKAEVKNKIEYKKVDVAAEIKTESQVNTAVEDTAVNNVPEESTATDTLPLLDSKSNGSKVSKEDVANAPKAAKASANGSQEASFARVVKKVVTPPAEENPTVPVTPPAAEEKPAVPVTPPAGENPTDPVTPEKPEEPNPPAGTPDDKDNTENNGGQTNPDASGNGEGTSTDGNTPNGGEGDNTLTNTTAQPEGQPASDSAEDGTMVSAARSLSAVSSRTGLMYPAAPSAAEEKTPATVSAMPETVTLYNSDDAASNSYTVNLAVKDDGGIIKSIDWSTDESIVALSAKTGASVTLTRKSNGSAEVKAVITYDADGAGATATAELKCKVTAADPGNSSEELKDKSGNTLYLDEKAETVATTKDYESHDTFYTTPQYTGWQTINGKVYYYNEEHKAVTGSQVIGGVSYTFASDGSLAQSAGNKGIDVSKYQGNIDWGAVAASGINFAIIRVGYRGSSTGVLVEDPYFRRNISGASKAGIKVGVYFFTQAVTEAEAVEEASMAMSLVAKTGCHLTYPIFIDTESASNGRANGLSRSARTAIVQAFCQTVQNGGYKAGVYASKSWFNNNLKASSLNSYCIWVAQYSSNCTYTGKHDMWQHTSRGSVSGIKGNVDMNISYTGY